MTSLNEIGPDPERVAEVRRNVDYALANLKDPVDNLYWRNWRLWTIDEERCDAWRALTGQDHVPVPDPSERSLENTGIPVEDRPMVKTLLGNAKMCQLLWLAGAVLQ